MNAATLVALLVVLPVLAVVQARALRGMSIPRIPAYTSSAATLVLLGGWCTVLGFWKGTPAALGFVALTPGAMVAWTVVVTLAGLGLMLGFRLVATALRVGESETLVDLLPGTTGERVAFAGLSLLAGLGEEIVFRGYALWALSGFTGLVAAGVITSLAFGMLHAYQGVLGVVRTAALGGLLAWGFVAAGSLWPVVGAHAVLDLLGGIVLADKLMSGAPTAGEARTGAELRDTEPARDTRDPDGVR